MSDLVGVVARVMHSIELAGVVVSTELELDLSEIAAGEIFASDTVQRVLRECAERWSS